jgi:hypothetical protein
MTRWASGSRGDRVGVVSEARYATAEGVRPHVRNCQQVTGAGRTLGDTWYRVRAFYSLVPQRFSARTRTPRSPGIGAAGLRAGNRRGRRWRRRRFAGAYATAACSTASKVAALCSAW